MIAFGRRIRTEWGYEEMLSMRAEDQNPLGVTRLVPTGRYSASILRETYQRVLNKDVAPHLEQHIEWAKGAKS